MNNENLRRVALTYGTVGLATTAALAGVAVLVGFPLKLLGFLLTAGALVVVPSIVGITDAGIDTAAASAEIGASTGNPDQYQTDGLLPVPNPVQVVCWLLGVGVTGIALLAATY